MRPTTLQHPHRWLVLAIATGLAALVTASAGPSRATLRGHNGLLLFTGDAGKHSQLFAIAPDGTQLRQITHLSGDNLQGAWSPDGARIAFERDFAKSGGLYVMRADGAAPKRLSPRADTFAGEPAWSPDGRQIVFGVTIPKRCQAHLSLIDPGGRHVRSIRTTHGCSDAAGYDAGASFAPDGKRLVFFHKRHPGSAAIFVIGVNGRGLERLTSYSGDYANPSWSPDGTKIVFDSYTDAKPGRSANLFTARPDGSGLTQLTHLTGGQLQAFGPVWSPDGTQIAYHKVGPGLSDLFLVNADGTNERPLTHLGERLNPRMIDWSPR